MAEEDSKEKLNVETIPVPNLEREKPAEEQKPVEPEKPVEEKKPKPKKKKLKPKNDEPKLSEIEEKAPSGEVTPKEAKEVAKGEFVSIKELAGTFGYSIAWVTHLVQEGRIHGVRPLGGGGNWRIPKSEVDRLTKQGLRKPDTTMKDEASEIKVTGEHIERVVTKPPEKKEQPEEEGEGKKVPWPLSFIFK